MVPPEVGEPKLETSENPGSQIGLSGLRIKNGGAGGRGSGPVPGAVSSGCNRLHLHPVRGLSVRLEFGLRVERSTGRLALEGLCSLGLRMGRRSMLHKCLLGGERRTARLTSEFWHVSRIRKLRYRTKLLSLTVKRQL